MFSINIPRRAFSNIVSRGLTEGDKFEIYFQPKPKGSGLKKERKADRGWSAVIIANIVPPFHINFVDGVPTDVLRDLASTLTQRQRELVFVFLAKVPMGILILLSPATSGNHGRLPPSSRS
ncbi:hypothetical protein BDZ45DRAFT_184524 [Acephala macrosclerotiorum]|nr:hypothetical protein BDZ45DRAFT_184524 [Acephala macrosclerotiorum]